MKKRIISSALSLVMLAGALVSCSDGASDGTSASTDEPETAQVTEAERVYPSEDDTFAGTPAYTVDGDNIIVDGVSYPNRNNYNCGPMVAVDDLGRELSTAEQTKNYTFNERYVGLFYFLWLGEHGDYDRVFDNMKILEEGGDKALFASYEGWGPQGAMHFYAEPLYGYYYSSDRWVQRKHVEELTNANVDFLYFDVTNGYSYMNNAKSLMKLLHEMREQGWDTPKVVFYTNSKSETVVNQLYAGIYSLNYCSDTWFTIDGKPVIIAFEDKIANSEIKNFFTFRVPQWPNEDVHHDGGWPWMDFGAGMPRVYTCDGKPDAISVSIAQHNATIQFSDSAFYGDNSNRGRSYHDGRNDRDPDAYLHGYNFQEQWDHAISTDAPYVLVTGWNEWVAQRQPSNANRVNFVDNASPNFSRDAEMMRGGYFDNYYMQLIENIRRLKGTAPTLVQNTRKIIDLAGSFDQWNDVLVTYSDFAEDTTDREGKTFGKGTVTDESGRNDIVAAKIICDTKYAYFYVKTAEAITEYAADTTWMQLFINADNETTGWYGYDYIVNYGPAANGKTTLAKYTGKDNAFAFEKAEDIDYTVSENQMMIRVPLASMGITDFEKIKFSFKWVDSEEKVDSMEKMYTSGDQAPHGRLNFIFQNYK